jgi:O-antigen/teichoic acid export membrane protein
VARESTSDPVAALGAGIDETESPPVRAIDTGGRSLRTHAARGVLVNGAFDVGLSGLGLIRGFVLAAILSRADYGVWGVLVVSLGLLASLKVVGISDKYVQQTEPDQELEFQRAFTLEVLVTAAVIVPIAAAVPLIALIYGQWKLVAPGIVLLTVLVANALQSPLWIPYRQMHFARQRTLSAIEPVVACVTSIVLALMGFGYWALALGLVAGAWSAALAALRSCPYRIRWRYDRSTLRVYWSFSGPIFIATASNVVLANGAMIATNAHLGLAGAGAVTLAANITAFTTRVDDLVSSTLYPAICAVQHRVDLLFETFVKSNRLALMWALPFGFGVALFSADVVHYVVGAKWHPAITLLQVTGVTAALAHIGFNWEGYFRARAQTGPLAVAAVCSALTLLVVGIPLLFSYGLAGLAIGIAAAAAAHFAVRTFYLRRLFAGQAFLRHAGRSLIPSALAAGAVLLARGLESSHHSAALAAMEVLVYAVIVAGATGYVERELLREAISYLHRRAR